MLEYIWEYIKGIMLTLHQEYNVNLTILVIVYVVTRVPYYFFLYRMLVAVRLKKFFRMKLDAIFAGLFCFAPEIYVLFFGKNLPLWVYFLLIAIVLVICYGIIILYRKNTTRNKVGPS